MRDTGFAPGVDKQVAREVLEHIGNNGLMAASDFAPMSGAGWGRSSPHKTACEWLASVGELVVINRDARWRRVFRTPAQAGMDTTETLTAAESVKESQRALGIATAGDVTDYLRLPKKTPVEQILVSHGCLKVEVSGTSGPWFVAPEVLEQTLDDRSESAEKVVPLSPLDSLVWTRPRQARLFNKPYLFEAYKPKASREFGYFSMPLLRGHSLIGRVAARKKSGKIVIENIQVDAEFNHQFDSIKTQVDAVLSLWIR